ncbi:MAG: amino acid ABC transporter permease [Bacteroidales bacterium]|nr:amino acid ABC transporter permease [Bacteroidales bacterium]
MYLIGEKLRASIEANLLTEDRWQVLLDGLGMTLKVSLLAILFATLWGAVLCAMRLSRKRVLSRTAGTYIELMRSLPILILLLVSFYIIFATSPLSKVQIAVVCFSLYFGAYFSEVFRTGIESVDKGQREAGAALGMSRGQIFGRIILPQALLRCLPLYKTQAVALIKGTSIVGYVSVMDLTKAGDFIRGRTFDAFFPLLLVALIYLILSWLFGTGIDLLERRLTPKHRSL